MFGLGGCGNKFRRRTFGRQGGPFNSLTVHALKSVCPSVRRNTGGKLRLSCSSVLGNEGNVARHRGMVGGCLGVMSVPPMSNYSVVAAVSMNVRSVTRGTLISRLGRVGTAMNITVLVRIRAKSVGTVIGVAGYGSNVCERVHGGTVSSVVRPNSAFGATSVLMTLSSKIVAPRAIIRANGKICVVRNHCVGSRG